MCQRVYFANHTSHLDAIVLWASLPSELRHITRPVAAKDYWEKGFVRRYMARTFNALLIDRRVIKVHQSPVDLMLREIGEQQSLIVFPEGSRNPEAEIGEFKSGLYYLAKKRPDLELVPVHIDNLNRVLPRGEFLPVPLLSLVTFGPPIWLESGEPKAEFLERARGAVQRLKDLEA
jgi:1-acyl-sn-glycerol-3-phosphate acyltransferase